MSVFPHRVGCVRARSSVAASPGSQRFSLTSMYEMHQSERGLYQPRNCTASHRQIGSVGGSRSKHATR
jgi:hypothetical protein